MVVDDNPSILEMLSSFLGILTVARIVSFQSSFKALEAFRAEPELYQLVITDLEMPGMNGVELCDQMRAHAPDLKIVLVTGNQSAVDAATSKDFGFSGLLYKPFTFGALEYLLENVEVLSANLAPANRS